MTKDEALKLALEALEHFRDTGTRPSDLAMSEDAITAIKEALAQPEQEPVAWQLKPHQPPEEGEFIEITARWGKRFVEVPDPIIGGNSLVRFYFDPPQRTWVGLRDSQKLIIIS